MHPLLTILGPFTRAVPGPQATRLISPLLPQASPALTLLRYNRFPGLGRVLVIRWQGVRVQNCRAVSMAWQCSSTQAPPWQWWKHTSMDQMTRSRHSSVNSPLVPLRPQLISTLVAGARLRAQMRHKLEDIRMYTGQCMGITQKCGQAKL
jgi:hypothetical protein